MGFKLGSESRRDASSRINAPQKKTISNTPIIKKDLGDGIQAEANNDGTIFVNSTLQEGTPEYNRAVKHELGHMNDIESGRADYGDNWVMWEGDIFFRREIDGEMYIDGPAGRLPEGHEDHPWEEAAIIAEGLETYEGIPIVDPEDLEQENI